jgi:NAD(P)-dependent dehydrogenase (short-subunit alcohol dehydrogenase family)
MAFEINLDGQIALVTGGARGIGAEVCRQMAIAGANIVINYYHIDKDRIAAREIENELKGYGVDVLLCEADVSQEEEVKKMISTVIERFGRLDILVNNAGLTLPSRFEEMNYETWKRVLNVVLDGTYFATRHTIPHMLKNEYGSIIMITTNCTINGGGGGANYPAAKAGVEGLAKQLVVEFASKGIRTNIVQPAVIDTELLRQRYPSDEDIEAYGNKLPVGRVGKPIDIANAVVFLASDRASYICGANLLVDGGRTYYKR